MYRAGLLVALGHVLSCLFIGIISLCPTAIVHTTGSGDYKVFITSPQHCSRDSNIPCW